MHPLTQHDIPPRTLSRSHLHILTHPHTTTYTPLTHLTTEELYLIATSERQGKLRHDNRTLVIIDEGMEDAACRALANAKATTGLIAGVDDIRVPPPVTEEETQRALGNVNHCVVGLLERWEETKAMLEFWFPWLDFSVDSYRRKMFIYR